MGLTEFIRVCLFVAAVVIVALAAFWLVKQVGLSPLAMKIATALIALIGLVVLALRFAGGVVPR